MWHDQKLFVIQKLLKDQEGELLDFPVPRTVLSHSNSVLVEPNTSAEIIWKFNTEAKLEAACNVPGHYEAGMIAKINNM
jgi:uncharacterized cupredoxin-like copper-binding protein